LVTEPAASAVPLTKAAASGQIRSWLTGSEQPERFW
jgi:hypothetical protein